MFFRSLELTAQDSGRASGVGVPSRLPSFGGIILQLEKNTTIKYLVQYSTAERVDRSNWEIEFSSSVLGYHPFGLLGEYMTGKGSSRLQVNVRLTSA